MELINVFLVFGGCQGALVTPLPLPPLFQVSTILHEVAFLGLFMIIKSSCGLQLQTTTTNL